jgi:hypothetical protein
MLVDRLRTSVMQLGYGDAGPNRTQIDGRDQLDPDVLEISILRAVASIRFSAGCV